METLQALKDAISEVLETMCYMCPVPVKAPPRERPSHCEWLVSVVNFTGGSQGRLKIHFPMEVAREIFFSITGRETVEPHHGELEDVLKEVTNMVAGGLLHRLDPGATTSMSFPALLEDNSWDPKLGAAFDLDGVMILAEFCWKEGNR